MKHFTIENETNNITLYGSVGEADAIPESEQFSTGARLGKLAGGPAGRGWEQPQSY